ncbi:MAG TPA: diacylglycerol kinase family protein [Acidimicrobiales bacterium]|nr:diacylglycerol kinase family protein [Acidimicrobiales bacterium]
MSGVVLVNPKSGPDETSPEEVGDHFPGSHVEELQGKEVRRQVEDAIASGAPTFLAVAGGDGTIRCAAGVLAGTDLPLVAIPAGTRNHFAKELGIASLEEAGQAAAGGVVDLIDIGEVNGEAFINNANIGLYPRIVKEREVHEKRFSKPTATLVATWAQMRDLHKFNVTVNGGTTYRAWMVFVGNGRYGTTLFDVGTRETLADGMLDVRILRADGRMARARVLGRLLFGRMDRSPMAEIDQVESIELAVDRAEVDVALDGEIVRMTSPLRFRCRPKALRVLVPPSSSADAAAD